MGRDKKDDSKPAGKCATPAKRNTRTKKKEKEEQQVDFPSLSLPSTSQEPPCQIDEEELHERMLDCRSMARPIKATAVRDLSSDEESTYTRRTVKRGRVRVGETLDPEESDFTPRSPSPRLDPGIADARTLTEFKVWMSEEFLKLRGTLDHILTEVTRVGKRLTEVEDSHRLEKFRIKSLQEKALSQTGNPPQNPTTPMAAPPSSSQQGKPSRNPWGGGKGVL